MLESKRKDTEIQRSDDVHALCATAQEVKRSLPPVEGKAHKMGFDGLLCCPYLFSSSSSW